MQNLPNAAIDSQGEGAERGETHQKVLVKDLSVDDVAQRAPQNVVSDDKIYGKIEQKGEDPRRLPFEDAAERDDFVRDENGGKRRERDDYANEIFLLLCA